MGSFGEGLAGCLLISAAAGLLSGLMMTTEWATLLMLFSLIGAQSAISGLLILLFLLLGWPKSETIWKRPRSFFCTPIVPAILLAIFLFCPNPTNLPTRIFAALGGICTPMLIVFAIGEFNRSSKD